MSFFEIRLVSTSNNQSEDPALERGGDIVGMYSFTDSVRVLIYKLHFVLLI